MRVNISYSIELEELLPKVVSFLSEVAQDLESTSKSLNDITANFDVCPLMDNVKTIDALRQKLAIIDNQLLDYSAILAGYQKTKAELYLSEQEKEKQLDKEISENAQKLIEQIGKEGQNDQIE